MRQLIKWIRSRFSMVCTGDVLFVDNVNGKEVKLYVDTFGVKWMAQSRFGFRCKRRPTDTTEKGE